MHSGRHLKVLEGKREKEEWEEKEAGENQGETNGGNRQIREGESLEPPRGERFREKGEEKAKMGRKR